MEADEKMKALDEIERRAIAVRKTMKEVCARASVAESTWYRVRGGKNVATLKTIGDLEDALTAFEAERAGA